MLRQPLPRPCEARTAAVVAAGTSIIATRGSAEAAAAGRKSTTSSIRSNSHSSSSKSTAGSPRGEVTAVVLVHRRGVSARRATDGPHRVRSSGAAAETRTRGGPRQRRGRGQEAAVGSGAAPVTPAGRQAAGRRQRRERPLVLDRKGSELGWRQHRRQEGLAVCKWSWPYVMEYGSVRQ